GLAQLRCLLYGTLHEHAAGEPGGLRTYLCRQGGGETAWPAAPYPRRHGRQRPHPEHAATRASAPARRQGFRADGLSERPSRNPRPTLSAHGPRLHAADAAAGTMNDDTASAVYTITLERKVPTSPERSEACMR